MKTFKWQIFSVTHIAVLTRHLVTLLITRGCVLPDVNAAVWVRSRCRATGHCGLHPMINGGRVGCRPGPVSDVWTDSLGNPLGATGCHRKIYIL